MINTDFLAAWLEFLKQRAQESDVINDRHYSFVFSGTLGEPIQIVAGWKSGFSKDYEDIFYISSADCAMSIKIVKADNPISLDDTFDFKALKTPINKESGEYEDVCVVLEKTDDPKALALFLAAEYDRILKCCITSS